MFEKILDCPKCEKRFHFECDGNNYPATIICPECGEESPAAEYYVLILCNQCHRKIKVSVEIINNSDNFCPKCGAEIRDNFLDTINNDALTLTGVVNDPEAGRMLKDGDFFDKFRIVSFLGRGGMAEVYLAEHLLLKQTCALKLMRQSLTQDNDPVFIKRFVREAKVAHSLNHPNIVHVFDAGNDFNTGFLFLAMEFVEGETLLDVMNRKTFSENELLELLRVMAYALKRLEEAKIVHRDIKPSNIMLTNEGIYKLMDLGIAKMESNHKDGDMTLTMEQTTIGTPGYAPPEQCRSAHDADIRSDIFSLGATLYHAATGYTPFQGDTPVALILNVMQKEPDPISDFRDDLSEDFIAIIEKMLKKDPRKRFQNSDELLRAAGEVTPGKSKGWHRGKIGVAVRKLTTGIFTSASSSGEGDVPVSFCRRFLTGIGKIILAILLILFAALNIYYIQDQLSEIPKFTSYKHFINSLFSSFNFFGNNDTPRQPQIRKYDPTPRQPQIRKYDPTPRQPRNLVHNPAPAQPQRRVSAPLPQYYSRQNPPVPHKSEALFPLLRPVRKDRFNQRQTVDEHLAALREEHREYSEAVQKLQESLKHMPATIPSAIRQKRKELAAMAARLCKMREKRFIYLEKRRNLVNAAKNRQYDAAAGKEVERLFAQYFSGRVSHEEKGNFDAKICRLLSKSNVDPNLRLRLQVNPSREVEWSILESTIRAALFKTLRYLLQRGADPAGLCFSGYAYPREISSDYGFTGRADLSHFFHQYESERQTLFLDGAFPEISHASRYISAKNYNALLFVLACGLNPNQTSYGTERPLVQAYRMPHGQKYRDLLLAAGADPALLSTEGKRPADYAPEGAFLESWAQEFPALNNELSAIRNSFKSGTISPDLVLANGYNLLYSACERGNETLVKLLFEYNVDIHKTGKWRTTPLAAVCRFIDKSSNKVSDSEKAGRLLLFLLEKGADFSYLPRNYSRQCSVMEQVLCNFPNRNLLIPHLAKYLGVLRPCQWPWVFRAAARQKSSILHGEGYPKTSVPLPKLTPENLLLLADKCPGETVKKYIAEFVTSYSTSILPAALLKKGFDAGLDPNVKIKVRVYFNKRWQTVQYPLVWHLIEYKAPRETIFTAIKAGADLHWKDHTGNTLRKKLNFR